MKSIIGDKDLTGVTRENGTGEEIQIKGGEKVRNAVRSLAHFGLITFSREQNFKSSYYTMHFFKPVSGLKNLYNLGNELLILCCLDGMRDFKSRTKDFLDYILTTKGEFKNRLDKVTCILIDANDEICDIVKEDRKEHPEARLIVPFGINELQSGISEADFQNRMRDFLYERDLFGIASPLQNDSLFFGKDRSNVISELYGKYKQGEQGGLFGLRRIGKTSVLNLLQLKIEQDNGVSIYFDCSRFHHQRWNDFLREIVKAIVHKYSGRDFDENETYLKDKVELGNMEQRYTEKQAALSFEEDIVALYRALGNKRILLVFDEIENISHTTSPSLHWKEGNDALFFWQVLRAIIQTNNELFSFIIAGVNPKCVESSSINGCDNPIFGIFGPIYMSLFDYEDIKNMVSSIGGHLGLEFEEEVYSKLVDDYGGHPFLTRQVCSKINRDLLEQKESRPFTVSKYRYESHAQEYQLEMSGVIEQILLVLENYYPIEFNLLKKLALDGRKSFKKEIELGEKAIQHLLGYCLLTKDDGEYFIRIKSIEQYLQKQFLNDQTLTSQADIRKRLNVRRSNLEEKLRTIVFHNLSLKYGKKAKEKLLEYVQGTTTDKTQEGKMQNVAFKKAMEELYFWQLKEIMCKSWKDYEHIFNDRVRFEQFFNVVNNSRGGGDHNRTVTEEDEAIYNIAFQYFDKCLREYE